MYNRTWNTINICFREQCIMKLLIFSASTGGGHKRAAAALEDTIHRLNPEVEVTVVDGLRAIGKMYDTTTVQGYYFLVKNAPGFYGEMYDITDRKNLAYKAMMKIKNFFKISFRFFA